LDWREPAQGAQRFTFGDFKGAKPSKYQDKIPYVMPIQIDNPKAVQPLGDLGMS
jgi:hypothetical protein